MVTIGSKKALSCILSQIVVKLKLQFLKISLSGINLTIVPVFLDSPIVFKGLKTLPPSWNLI